VCGYDDCKKIIDYVSSELLKMKNINDICKEVVMLMISKKIELKKFHESPIKELQIGEIMENENLADDFHSDIETLTIEIPNFEVLQKLDNLRKLTCTRPSIVFNCLFPNLVELTISLFSGNHDFSGFPNLEILIITGNQYPKIIEELDLRASDKLKVFKIDPNFNLKRIIFSDNVILNSLQINAMTETNAIVINLDVIDNNNKAMNYDYSSYSICDNITFVQNEVKTMKKKSLILPINILTCNINCSILEKITPALSLTNLIINTHELCFSKFDVSFPELKTLTISVNNTDKMTIYLPKLLTEFNINLESRNLTVMLNRRIEKITGKIPFNIFQKTGNTDDLYCVELNCNDPSLEIMFSDVAHLSLS